MLKNKKIKFVIALLGAICLWAYVLGYDGSSYGGTMRNIPVNYINADALEKAGLVVLETPTETVNISYTGQRSLKNKVKASDFKATVDLEGLREGENTVKINVEKPENVDIKSVSVQKVTVVVDRLVQDDKPVRVVITNQNSDDSEPYIVQVSRQKVNVRGAESLVSRVTELIASVDALKVGNTMKSLNIELVPVDENGTNVENVSLEYDNVSVTTIMHNKKTVSLRVPITGNDNSYVNREITVPKTVTVKGTDELLSRIDSITCRPVDVSDVFEDTVIDLEPVLPEGLEIATDSQNLQMVVAVAGADTRVFTFSENDIVLEGVDEDTIPTLENITVRVSVSGNGVVVEQITESDFRLYADVSGLGKGTHTVPLKCVCENKNLELEYNPSEIKVIIE